MKKIIISKLFVVLLLGINLFFINFLNSVNVSGFSSYNDSSIISYDENYKLNQLEDYRKSLTVNNNDLDIYNTKDLIEEIFYSQFNNSIEDGIKIFKNNNLYFKELLNRKDASTVLISIYDEIN